MKTIHEFESWLKRLLPGQHNEEATRLLKTILWQLRPITDGDFGKFVNGSPANDELGVVK